MATASETSPATHGTGLEPPRSDTLGDASALTGVSDATGSQKRGRGRPPKPKSDDSQQNGAVPARRPRGRPKRNRDPAAAVPTAVVKSGRGRGRPKRSNTLSPAESLVEGSRKRGRPKKDDVAAPAKKRGRKPKSEQVAKRSVGRPKKATEGTGQGAADTRELKKKAALLQKKVKQATEKLKIAVSAITEVQELAAGMWKL